MSANPDIPHDLGSIELENTQGEFHRLDDYWRDQTIVLAFVRHFG